MAQAATYRRHKRYVNRKIVFYAKQLRSCRQGSISASRRFRRGHGSERGAGRRGLFVVEKDVRDWANERPSTLTTVPAMEPRSTPFKSALGASSRLFFAHQKHRAEKPRRDGLYLIEVLHLKSISILRDERAVIVRRQC